MEIPVPDLYSKPLQISSRAASKLAAGSLWIFSNEISMPKETVPPGTWCTFESTGRIVGTGYFNFHSLIAGRILSRESSPDIHALLSQRLEDSFRRRSTLFSGGSARLVFSEADFLPGLIVDGYGDTAVIQSNTAGIDSILPALKLLVPEIFARVFQRPLRGLVARGDSSIRKLEGIENFRDIVLGEEPQIRQGTVQEGNVQYAADFLEGQKTGFFLDQRENRSYLKSLMHGSEGKTVLDLFCYSGGWGLRALQEGAAEVSFVDQSEEARLLVERGLTLNGLAKERARFQVEDVFDFLEKDQRTYDVVVSDPPAFVKSNKNLNQAKRAYEKLNRLAWRRVKTGGVLLTSSCSYHLAEQDFMEILRSSVAKEGIAHVVYQGHQAGDHPILLSMPETRYLKCVGLRKLAG